MLTPSRVTDQELFPLEVHVYSQMTTPGEVELLMAGETLETREVDLIPGINRIAFEIRVSETGPVNIQAAVRVQNDTVPETTFSGVVAVDGKTQGPVHRRPGRECALPAGHSWVGEGIDVEVRTPGDIPLSVEEYDAFETIVLSDVRADALTDGQMDALATYVRDLGGGFILAGGDSVFRRRRLFGNTDRRDSAGQLRPGAGAAYGFADNRSGQVRKHGREQTWNWPRKPQKPRWKFWTTTT